MFSTHTGRALRLGLLALTLSLGSTPCRAEENAATAQKHLESGHAHREKDEYSQALDDYVQALKLDTTMASKVAASIEANPARLPNPPFLLAIEDVFSITGRGTVVTGRVVRGELKAGQEVEVVGFKDTRKTTVTGIEAFRKIVESARVGDNVGVLLRGIGKDDVKRGEVLAAPGSLAPHTQFEAEVYLLTKEEGGRSNPIFKNYRPQFYFRTTDVTGTVTDLGADLVNPGERKRFKVELIENAAIEEGLLFAIREGGKTVGMGVVAKIVK